MFETVGKEMAVFKNKLQEFRRCTTLDLLCKAVSCTKENPCSPGFRETAVTEYKWTGTIYDGR